MSNIINETVFLVWNLRENIEVRNFSINGSYTFVHGPNSNTGYILHSFKYINLDNCLPNYFFDYDFTGISLNNNGYKINKNEELIAIDGNLLMKTLYMESVSLDRYISGVDKIEHGQLAKHNLKFQISGNTIFHLFALDTTSLALICEYLEENKKDYLNAILMRNFDGETPLDITIKQDSPKNTDLMLRSLSKIREAKYSDQFYKRFPQLLAMELRSFHYYLDSCRFQTAQMQNTHYLALKDNNDTLVVAHNT